MQTQKEKVANRYVEFMGSWMVGSIIGHYVAKIITTGFVLWLIYKAFFS